MRIAFLLVLATAACAGTEVDMGNGPACTKALYDTCASEHDCMSNDCRSFNAEGFSACTQPCSASTPCPELDGVAVACDTTTGLCKPAMARQCRIVP